MRELTVKEIKELEQRGCSAEEWSDILVDESFCADQVRNVSFYGHIELGCMLGTLMMEEGFPARCGVYNAVLRNVNIGDGCLIRNVRGYISNYEIGNECLISDVGTISTLGTPGFGNGNVISVLNEGGDGNVVIYTGLTAQIAALMLDHPEVRQMALDEVALAPVRSAGCIGNNVRIVGAKEICNAIIEDGAEINGATHINSVTVMSDEDSATFIGPDAIIENSIVAKGATVADGAKVENSFVGESVHVGKGFSSESSLFFANSYMDNGEACAALCGPFSCSHHKSTLLIGGEFSFYNAGSNTNQSNHAYKMGPIHWGRLDRGAKTASGSHILWPAHFGSFSMIMGKVTSHPDVHNLPFSYIIANGDRTYLVPGINLKTVGTWRDINKWPKRDQRSRNSRKDIINFAFPNPFIIQQVLEGIKILQTLSENQEQNTEEYEYEGCIIKHSALVRGLKYYDMAIKLFLRSVMNAGSIDNGYQTGADEWVDLGGMLAPKKEIDRLVADICDHIICDTKSLITSLYNIHKDYTASAAGYAQALMQKMDGDIFVNTERWRNECEEAHAMWLKMVRDDAEKEYGLGDVEEEQLRDFLSSVK